MKREVIAFLAGIVFALGLGISGMLDPRRILGFLDVTGAWDPTLALVMVGAVGVHVAVVRWAMLSQKPLCAAVFSFPRRQGLDGRLFAGAAIFGVGWGLAGFCPGPAIVAVVTSAPRVLVFTGAMLAGVLLFHAVSRRAYGAARRPAASR
ncbi:MAG: YeeE/YedE family protein [Myxococcales bacterium]|nr:YeeE/YedE family protein [Myxococcales bacterium]